jgi:hypothetical protein
LYGVDVLLGRSRTRHGHPFSRARCASSRCTPSSRTSWPATVCLRRTSCRVLCAFVRPGARPGRRGREGAGRLQGQHKAVEEVPGIGPGYVRSSVAAAAASSSWISASISVASLRCS